MALELAFVRCHLHTHILVTIHGEKLSSFRLFVFDRTLFLVMMQGDGYIARRVSYVFAFVFFFHHTLFLVMIQGDGDVARRVLYVAFVFIYCIHMPVDVHKDCIASAFCE